MLRQKKGARRRELITSWHRFGGTESIFRKKSRFALLLSLLFATSIFSEINASVGVAVIEAHIGKLRNNNGQVICTLFTPADQFPERSHKGMTLKVPIQNDRAVCRFENVRYGDYAIVVFHDENRDGEFNQNWLGMPKEGFGFSQNPGTLKKPVFGDAKFSVDQPLVEVTIKLNYWF
ncbi:MAG: DUF2141 domain-containing protein [Verrucomicrobia bacterium]|nr:DUF2141 domain-containing protein [Verrucomicrobiota bacterium]